jgi:hypothetical protein
VYFVEVIYYKELTHLIIEAQKYHGLHL